MKTLADKFPTATTIAKAFDRDSLLPKSKSKSSSKSNKSSSSEGPTRVEVLSELFDLLSHSSFSHTSSSNPNNETSTLPISTYSSPNLPLHGLQLLSGSGTSHLPLSLGGHRGGTARTMASWTIEYAKAGSEIKLQLLHVCVEEQFGKEAARIVGVVAKKGRVDEKMVSVELYDREDTICLHKKADITLSPHTLLNYSSS